MVQVIFNYDEACRKWEAVVKGVASEEEAKQAFNAVVVTSREIVVCMLHRTKQVNDEFHITPAV